MSENLSAKWLKHAQRQVNDDPAFRKLGSVDANVGLKVDGSAFLVRFSGFSCHDVRKIAAKDLRDADFVVEMSRTAWSRYLDGRRDGSAPTLAALDVTDDVVKAADPRKKLDFLRYHLSLQAFIDAGAAQAPAG